MSVTFNFKATVIRMENSESMNAKLCIVGFLVALSWSFYGLLIDNLFVQVCFQILLDFNLLTILGTKYVRSSCVHSATCSFGKVHHREPSNKEQIPRKEAYQKSQRVCDECYVMVVC